MKKAHIIYNPTPGKELSKRDLAGILQALGEVGFEASAYAATPEPDSAKNKARRVAELGFNLVVAAGGGGATNKMVNGIAPFEHHPKMVIIPVSTMSDYARTLKIPRSNIKTAVEVIKKHQTVKMDIGLPDNSYFINIAAGGYLTELAYEVPSELKSILGYLAYPTKGAEMLPRIKPIKVRSRCDEGEYIGNAPMFFLGLTNSVGRFEQIVPDVRLDDDRPSLIIVKTANIFEILHIATPMLSGSRHINDPRVVHTKTSSLFVGIEDDINRPVMINLDGKHGGGALMRFQDLHQHIEFSTSAGQTPDEAIIGTDEEELEVVSEKFIEEIERLVDEDIDGDRKITDRTPNQKNQPEAGAERSKVSAGFSRVVN